VNNCFLTRLGRLQKMQKDVKNDSLTRPHGHPKRGSFLRTHFPLLPFPIGTMHFPPSRLPHPEHHLGWLAGILLGLALSVATAEATNEAASTERRLADAAGYLASDELEGRGVGTQGIDRAADYIASQFAQAGLKTRLFDGSPFQTFRMTATATLGTNNQLVIQGPVPKEGGRPQRTELQLHADFVPLSMSGSGKFDLPLAFVGYGITAPEAGYDDYANIDVSGKAVIILRHEPRQSDPHSAFNGTGDSEHAPLRRKASNAFQHGASAVLFVTDDHAIQSDLDRARKHWHESIEQLVKQHAEFQNVKNPTPEQLEIQRTRIDELVRQIRRASDGLREAYDPVLPFSYGERNAEARDFPVIHCRRAVLDPMVRSALGKDLATLEREIDQAPSPRSQAVEGWRIVGEVSVERSDAEAKNVLGVLEGRGPLVEECVVIGAHYDHLGWGGAGSLEPNQKAIHNGADDNASGVAVLLEVARLLASRPEPLRRTVVFIAFTGEESGLVGSSHYVQNPLRPLDQTVAMLNLDMVGRLRDEKLMVNGSGTAKSFDGLLDRLNSRHGFQLVKLSTGYAPSDQMLFYAKQVPVLQFFTGTHEDYHRPTDDFEKLNLRGMRRVTQFVADLAVAIADDEQRPEYVTLPPPVRTGGQRPYFGSIPDFAHHGQGYALSGVVKGSPADRAGLQPGDVVVRFGENKVGNLEDFDAALRRTHGGDRVLVVVQRDNQERTFEVTLEAPR